MKEQFKHEEGTTYVAVYGTLRQGFSNHHRINQDPIAEIQMPGYKMRTLGAFPVVQFTGDVENDVVTAEIHALDDSKLRSCDQLEGHPNWYERKVCGRLQGKLVGIPEHGKEFPFWMYLMPKDEYQDAEVVPSGDWAIHTGRTEEEKDDA